MKKQDYMLIISLCYFVILLFSPILVKAEPMRTPPPVKIDYISSKPMTRCAGRFLIDIPEKFIAKNNNRSQINSVIISSQQPISLNDFNFILKKREADLRDESKQYFFDETDKPFLKAVESLPNNMPGIIFNRNQSRGLTDTLRILETYYWNNNVLMQLEIKADDGSAEKYAEKRKKDPSLYSTNISEKRQDILNLIPRLQGWDNIHIPQEQGSCYTNVFIKGPANITEDGTNGYLYIDKEKREAISLIIDYNSFIKEKTTMLQRIAKSDVVPGGKVIRKGVVKLPHMPNAYAEELLTEDSNGKLDFALLINERSGSMKTPYTGITLRDGGALNVKEALAIWDEVIPTIRPRPGAF